MHNNDRGEVVYCLLQNAQRRFAKARLEMGIYLEAIRREGHWKGRASSFPQFLEEERINSKAANQYMRVARKLFYELLLSEDDFEQILTAGMGILEKACAVITPENRDEVLAIVAALSTRDAELALAEMDETAIPDSNARTPAVEKGVNKVMGLYQALTDDQRIEVLRRLTSHPTSRPVTPS